MTALGIAYGDVGTNTLFAFVNVLAANILSLRHQITSRARSLRQLKLPVKVVVFKNEALAFVELEMKAAGILDYATELCNPDFAQITEAAGLMGLAAEKPNQVKPMITEALKHDGPALVEVLVHRQELAMPPSLGFEEMAGFALFMLKAVLSGCGDEIIDLAKINLFR